MRRTIITHPIARMILCVASIVLAFSASRGMAGNPLIKDVGMSDPHVRVYGDKVYLYCGHDTAPTDRTWVMKEWRIFSSSNLIDWAQEGTVSPSENYMDDDSTSCWACDAATRNGTYYFYFSDHKDGIGVMTSDHPSGPFVDALGKPLVAPLHDPTAFVDDDAAQTPYLVYGDKSIAYKIARLNDDMISLAEEPRVIEINGEAWEQAPHWMDKNYLFKRNGVYYLSWGQDYAISKNVYGPYECAGKVGNGFKLDVLAHGSFFEWKGQFYHIWCYYINPRFKYRETIMTYCHFGDDGRIVDDVDFLKQHFSNGVGQYDAAWPKIEAEWYYEKSPLIQKQECANGGFEVAGIEEGSWIRFAHVDFDMGGYSTFSACINADEKGGALEIRLDALNGPKLGTVTVDQVGGQVVSGSVKPVFGTHDIYIKFVGEKAPSVRLDWWCVEK